MLSLLNLSKSFLQIPAVQNVSFDALPGQITGYLGPNGSGKSTTMKIITGLLQPSSGEVLFNGQPVALNPIAFQQRLGYVPEEPHLYSHLTGLEYLTMVAELRDLPTSQSRPLKFRKIPFTCSYLPGKSYIHISVFAALALMWVIVLAARHEREILSNTPILIALLTILAIITLTLHTIRKCTAVTEVDYEDTDPHQITSLNLQR